jgi:WhiB family transcriptional regulator, redox-sensing transcriptional regulator
MATTTLTRSPRRSTDQAVPADLRWRWRAACRDTGPAVFFPAGNSQLRQAEERAKAVCSSCPVRACCLAFAIEHDEAHGVWGGLTTEERRARTAALPNNAGGS